MDLFHSVTQGIDRVLTCHWYDELKNFKMGGSDDSSSSSSGNNDNSRKASTDKTMDTVPGGENTQYESIYTENVPSAKQRGQLGTGPNSSKPEDSPSEDRAQKTTENIRYGQNISEFGMGGMTTTSTGHASQEGYGGVSADKDQETTTQTRREQGYGGGSGVGA